MKTVRSCEASPRARPLLEARARGTRAFVTRSTTLAGRTELYEPCGYRPWRDCLTGSFSMPRSASPA
jgi:hypothetical protein